MSSYLALRLLLVDDEPDIHAIARSIFEEETNWEVRYCRSGKEALEALEDFVPHLVLLDLVMPEMDGIEFLKAMRETSEGRDLPVIFLTAEDGADREKTRHWGVVEVITKPFDPRTFLKQIKAIWNHLPRRPDPPSPRGKDHSLHRRLEKLRRRYLARLPEEIDELEKGWQELHRHWTEEGMDQLYRRTHRLAGTSGTYGLSQISQQLRTLEIYLKSLMKSSLPPSMGRRGQIDQLIDSLRDIDLQEDSAQFMMAVRMDTEGEDPPRQRNNTIYILEKDEFLARNLAKQISHFGYEVSRFSHPSDLIEAMEEKGPAVMVVDVETVQRKGEETIDLTPLSPAGDHSSIIFISSHNTLEHRLQAVRHGGRAYLTKPVDPTELVDKLDEISSPPRVEPYRILIIEDDEKVAQLYASILERVGMETLIITDATKVIPTLIEFRPDLVLMDIYMPINGLELAMVIRQYDTFVSLPIIFISTESNVDKQMIAISRGGDGFLRKPIQPNHLVVAVTARAKRYRQLNSFMVRDSLTGLFNHTKTKEFLKVEVARAIRQHTRLAFSMVDIDHFKSINDRHGHLTGDRVIKSLSRLLQQRLRETDIIGRYGGEEFAVIMPGTGGREAQKVMDEIRLAFSQLRQVSSDEEFYATFSCGVATFVQYDTASELNDGADKALYRAKELGRNRVERDGE